MEEWVMYNLDQDFKQYFPKLGYTLKEFQKKAISNAVGQGNTLCIMPTGGGKSVIYWMSAIELGGITLVVSPLTALIEEQSAKLKAHGYETLIIGGGKKESAQVKELSAFAHHIVNPRFVFASPEKFATDGYFEYCLKQRKSEITLMVIDEVHCVSQWGVSFRPFYKRIPDFLNRVFGDNDWCRVLALTATLNPMELKDICQNFRIEQQNIIKDTLLMRSEIQLHVKKFINEAEKESYFWELLERHRDEKTLVYLYRKKGERGVAGLTQKAIENGYKAAEFHGDMNSRERMQIIEQYRSNEIKLVIATNAFGMGIDIPDIRNVIHFMIPESAEQYYQEVGRAARDGFGANAYLLYSNKNIDVKRTTFIDGSFPTEEKLRETYKNVGKKIGYRTLPYFDNEDIQQCLPYYLSSGLISIICKGFSGLSEVDDIKDPLIQKLYGSTPSKGFVKIVKKNSVSPAELAEIVYSAYLHGNIKLKKPLERWLVINVMNTEISDAQMKTMLDDIEEKRQYKHGLLNYFIYVLENNHNSQHLHQEIARYLGMDKYHLNRIYKTEDGNNVRSKSEVIICEQLAKAGIRYKYEEPLEYKSGKYISPDFTLYLDDGGIYYWEHVGMLGNEDYDDNWTKKLRIYNECFPGQLIKTYESGAIAIDARKIIDGFSNR